MKRFMLYGTLVLVFASVGLNSRTASAIPPNPVLPNLLGKWVAVVGEFPVTMEFTQQKNRSFFGVVTPSDPIHPPNPIRMNVSASGNLSAQAHGTSYMLHGHGQYFVDAFGPMLMLDVTIQDQNGKRSVDTLVLVPENFIDF